MSYSIAILKSKLLTERINKEVAQKSIHPSRGTEFNKMWERALKEANKRIPDLEQAINILKNEKQGK